MGRYTNDQRAQYDSSQEEVAAELGVSRQRVDQIERKALKKCREGFLARGIDEGTVMELLRKAFRRTASWDRLREN